MSDVIPLPKRNIQQMSTMELKTLWDLWNGDPNKKLGEFDHEAVFFELNRRGEGNYCAV